MILFTISTTHGLAYSSEAALQSRNGLLYFGLQGLWDHTLFFLIQGDGIPPTLYFCCKLLTG